MKKNKMALTILLLLPLIVFYLDFTGMTISQPTITWLHTDGGSIKNAYGQVVYLTGVGLQEFLFSDQVGGGGEPAKVTGRIKEVGANHIRISIELLERYADPTNHPTFKTNLDALIQEAVNDELYVYIAFHYGSSMYNDLQLALIDDTAYTTYEGDTYSNARQAWMDSIKDVANRYKDISNVFGYQIWGEPAWANETRYPPGGTTSQGFQDLFNDWWQFNMESTQAIHSVNPDAIVIVGTPGYYWHKEVSKLYRANPIPEPNVAYYWQNYFYEGYEVLQGTEWWAFGRFYHDWIRNNGSVYGADHELSKQKMKDYFIDKALWMVEENVAPVILAEFGFGNDLNGSAYVGNAYGDIEPIIAQDFYDLFRDYQTAWTQFAWWGGSGWTLIESDYYTLTASGELMSQNFASLPIPPEETPPDETEPTPGNGNQTEPTEPQQQEPSDITRYQRTIIASAVSVSMIAYVWINRRKIG